MDATMSRKSKQEPVPDVLSILDRYMKQIAQCGCDECEE
jgi:hypothetical protein